MTELERDQAGMQSLGELVALAESSIDPDRKKLTKRVAQLQGALLRLVHSSTEVSSMTVEASPSGVQYRASQRCAVCSTRSSSAR